ncbi:MAG: hypothetical protein HKM24_01940 [Gammaproteobacteria bacterium]|nr:hypothetical protein [Gammaproteobacteria bacterium]
MNMRNGAWPRDSDDGFDDAVDALYDRITDLVDRGVLPDVVSPLGEGNAVLVCEALNHAANSGVERLYQHKLETIAAAAAMDGVIAAWVVKSDKEDEDGIALPDSHFVHLYHPAVGCASFEIRSAAVDKLNELFTYYGVVPEKESAIEWKDVPEWHQRQLVASVALYDDDAREKLATLVTNKEAEPED